MCWMGRVRAMFRCDRIFTITLIPALGSPRYGLPYTVTIERAYGYVVLKCVIVDVLWGGLDSSWVLTFVLCVVLVVPPALVTRT